MKARFITPLPSPPTGFENIRLVRSKLLAGPVVVLLEAVEPFCGQFAPYLKRMNGCLVTVAEGVALSTITERLWHLQVPAGMLDDLHLLLQPMMQSLGRAIGDEDRTLLLERQLHRSQRSLTETTEDYRRVNEALLAKVNDLTAAQAEIIELNHVLELRVRERTADLQKTLEQMQQAQAHLIQAEKLAGLGSMVAGVAHEINTPLGNCVLTASSLKDTVDEVLASVEGGRINRQEFVHHMQLLQQGFELLNTNLSRGADLVGRFKQVAADQSFEERRCFNMGELIEDTVAAMSPRLKRSHCNVRVECPEDIELESYPGDFGQILMNLILNSLLHGFEERPGGRIHIRVHRGEELQIEYSDSGQGLNAEAHQRLFEPFYTTSREKGGTGLGMAIIHNLVTQRLGGSIRLISEVGQPVHFQIRAPLEAPQQCSLS